MPGIPLLDRDRVQQPAPADTEAVRIDDTGHAGGLELAQKERRSQVLAIAVGLVRRLVRWDSEDDRIVAVIDGLDVQDRLGALARRVVPGPLAERTLGSFPVVM